jgi:hypothetical protein
LIRVIQDADDRYPVAADLLGNISVEILSCHNLDLALGRPRNGDHRQQSDRQGNEDFHRQPQKFTRKINVSTLKM